MEVTATPLVRDVTDAIKRKHNQGFEAMAQAALDACHAEAMLGALRLLVAAKDEKDRFGTTPRYEALKAEGWKAARAIVAKLESPQPPAPVLGYCPICGAPGLSREKRPFGNDRCEAGHCYPSSNALLAKLEGQS